MALQKHLQLLRNKSIFENYEAAVEAVYAKEDVEDGVPALFRYFSEDASGDTEVKSLLALRYQGEEGESWTILDAELDADQIKEIIKEYLKENVQGEAEEGKFVSDVKVNEDGVVEVTYSQVEAKDVKFEKGEDSQLESENVNDAINELEAKANEAIEELADEMEDAIEEINSAMTEMEEALRKDLDIELEKDDSGLVYTLKQGGEVVNTINIPKDQFLKNAEFIAEMPEEEAEEHGLVAGNPYLKFTWQLDEAKEGEENAKVSYVPVKGLVDTYTAEEDAEEVQLAIENNVISATIVEKAVDMSKLADEVVEEMDSHIKGVAVNGVSGTIEDQFASIEMDTDDLTIGAVENPKETDVIKEGEQLTDALAALEDKIDQAIAGSLKQVYFNDVEAELNEDGTVATLAVDAADLTMGDAYDVSGATAEAIAPEDTVQEAIAKLEARANEAISVVAGDGIDITGEDTEKTIAVKLAEGEASESGVPHSSLAFDAQGGLYVYGFDAGYFDAPEAGEEF